ncbi:hypothetical protein JL475_00210 [Streptomyces sp. M2CJ-2]|uniref:hypothetical protein n=1 Tax=Streptomyces sp. M2CJ-2 TaxID=2803948 RepID=UPI001921C3D0|nr:hypothetical protein [Streptomyces sp. M2CJ-2]MBL3664468.1 hypothetical protein [Streptomyces sp. M2CJ-2]
MTTDPTADLAAKLKRARGLHRETCPLAQGSVPPTAFKCGMCEVLDAPAAVPVSSPPADRAAEERVARRLAGAWITDSDWQRYDASLRADYRAYAREVIALAQGAPADRAAVLREAIAVLDRRATGIDALSSSDFGEEARAVRELADAANELRRMAAEPPAAQPRHIPDCPPDCPCRAVCIGARQDGALDTEAQPALAYVGGCTCAPGPEGQHEGHCGYVPDETPTAACGRPASMATPCSAGDHCCKGPAEEAHVVADDSDDPEHVDDCPGCEAFTLTGHVSEAPQDGARP